jgi:hypothetical protein
VVQYRHVTDSGRDHHNFSEAKLTIEPWKAPAEVFAVPTNTTADATATTVGTTTQTIVPEGEELARGGYSDKGGEAGNGIRPSFVYRPEAPLLRQGDVDEAVLRGDFQLFLDDVEMTVERRDGSTWTNWTGFRESGDGATSSYEMRVTTIAVEGGTLRVANGTGLGILSRALAANFEGSIVVENAQGRVVEGEASAVLRDESLNLRGSGTLVSRASSTAAGDPLLWATAEGDLEPLSSELAAALAPSSPSSSHGPLATAIAAGCLLLLAAGLVAIRRPAMLRVLPEALRQRLYRRWRARAARCEDERAFGKAARAYGKLVALYPDRGTGWYGRTRSLTEEGHHEEVLATIDRARDHLDPPPLDLLQFEIAAASTIGERERAKRALRELGRGSPRMARSLVSDLGLEDLVAEESDWPWDRGDPGGWHLA